MPEIRFSNSFFKLILFTILFSGIAINLPAQGELSGEAEVLVAKAGAYAEKENYVKAAEYFQKAMSLYQEQERWEKYIETGIERAMNLESGGSPDSAFAQMDSLIQTGELHLGKRHLVIAQVFHKLGVLYYWYDDFQRAIASYSEALAIRKTLLPAGHPDIAQSYYNIGLCYSFLGAYKKAIETLDESINIRKANGDNTRLAKSYQQSGINYELLGDFEQAVFYQELALQLMLEIYGVSNKNVADAYFNIGNLHDVRGKSPEAIAAIEKALDIYQHLKLPEQEANCMHTLGNIYDNKSEYTKALHHFRQAMSLYHTVHAPISLAVSNTHINIGIVYKKLGLLNKALVQLDSSHLILNTLFGNQRTAELAVLYDNKGNILHQGGKYADATNQYQLALSQLLPSFAPRSIRDNPSLESIFLTDQKTYLLTILSDKAISLVEYYKQTDSLSNLLAALEAFSLCDQLIDRMRREYTSEGSKLFWTEKTRPLYENAIELCITLNELIPNQDYLQQAFRYAEKSKASLLLESKKEIAARGFADIPPDILQQEKQFREHIIRLEQQLFQIQITGNSTSVRDSLLQVNRAYDMFIKTLETNYPNYHRVKYNTNVVDVATIRQQLLGKNEALIAYSAGTRATFIFTITNTAFFVTKAPPVYAELSAVGQFRSSLTNKKDIEENSYGNYQQFVQSGRHLFQSYLEEAIQSLDIKTKKLYIIPDGLLSYLPFECFILTKPLSSQPDFLQLDYLIRHYKISYNYSASLLQQNIGRSRQLKSSQKLLAFAPLYKPGGVLAPLPGAKAEVQAIQSIYPDHHIFLDQQATKENFIKQVEHFDIIHLAMHGSVDPVELNNSSLSFSNDKEEGIHSTIYHYELYAFDLKARLVVLSACETGLGQLINGEGVMSLARGFMNAGSSSVLMSLWKTNDKASKNIMVSFHRALAGGQTKDQALQKAKLEYLENPVDPSGHPYYWAGFVGIGDPQAIYIKKASGIWFLLGIGIILFAGLVFVLRQRTQ